METPTIEQKKYKMEKDFKEKLKIFFMIIRPSNSPMILNERAIGIIGYRSEEAIESVRQTYLKENPNFTVIFHGDNMPIDEFLSKIDHEKIVVKPPVQIMPPLEEIPRMTKKQFINNLTMVASDFVKDEKETKTLKDIIGKIK